MGIRAIREFDEHGHAHFLDEHGRDHATCLADARLAETHAETLRAIVASRPIPGGREAGPRLMNRLQVSAETFDRLVERDRSYAEQLAQWDRRWEIRT